MKKLFTLLSISVLLITIVSTQTIAQGPTTIEGIKALYQGTNIGSLPTGTILSGVVISDTTNKNYTKGAAIVQSGNQGITLYTRVNVYSVGDSINMDISGDSLIIFNGSLEVKRKTAITIALNPVPVAKNVVVTPVVMTVQEILNNIQTAQCTLIKILNATAGPTDSSYGGSRSLTDSSSGTNALTLYTAKATATFAKTILPKGAQDWVGYPVYYAKGTTVSNEFLIRSLSDVTAPLPLNFTGFTVLNSGLKVLLSWNTANEVNSSRFIVEKSLDGIAYTALGTVSAFGSSSNSYSFNDGVNKLGTTAYYRLKSLDKDGVYKYSNVQKVQFSGAGRLTVYPNPAFSTTRLVYKSLTKDATARIISTNGKLIKQIVLKSGTTSSDINVSDLAKGVYNIELSSDKSTASFIKN